MKRFECIGKTDYKGKIQEIGKIIVVTPKEAKLFKGHPSWKELISVAQLQKEAELAQELADKEAKEAEETRILLEKEEAEAEAAKVAAEEAAKKVK